MKVLTRAQRSLLPALTALAVVVPAGSAAAAPTLVSDLQANSPQVAGMPASDATAVFPTNKQNETTIARNPADGTFLAGSNDEQEQPPCGPGPVRGPAAEPSDCSFFPGVGTNGVYRRLAGAAGWTNLGLIDDQLAWQKAPFVSDGDPVIVYGPKPDGSGQRAYYVSLASYKPGQSPFPPNKAPELIVSSFSDNNGDTWSAPVVASTKANPNTFNDKNSAWVDNEPTSPFYGRLYIGFTAFRSVGSGLPGAPIEVTFSADGGQTFAASKQLTGAANNNARNGRQGTAIATDRNGKVYVAFEQFTGQYVTSSTDGGKSWTRPAQVAPVTDVASPVPGANFRTDSFPSIAVTPGGTRVHLVWPDAATGSGRVLYVTSATGASWSAPATVSTAAQGYAFDASVSAAPGGRVDVGWQSVTHVVDKATFGTGNARVDAFVAQSAGTGFAAVQVNTAPSDPAASAQNNLRAQFWGDYGTIVSSADAAYYTYTDSRRGVGCPAVDAFQHFVVDNGLPNAEEKETTAKDAGVEDAADAVKPAPPLVCPPQFGNTDAYVATVTP